MDSTEVATCYSPGIADANAALIVRAVNSHDALVAALRGLVDRLDDHFGGRDRSTDWREQEAARAALEQAEGGAR